MHLFLTPECIKLFLFVIWDSLFLFPASPRNIFVNKWHIILPWGKPCTFKASLKFWLFLNILLYIKTCVNYLGNKQTSKA